MSKKPPVTLLIVASSFSPLAMTALVPGLPAIGDEFDLPLSTVQFVISIYLLGLALAQPVHGALADRFGRRPVFLLGFGVFILASLACALCSTMPWLVLFRLLQAAGIATATVVTRAMLRDIFDIDDSARYTAYLSGGMGVATMLAPALSGYLIETWGWRLSFYAMAALALPVFLRLFAARP
ncbi:MAG: multidrug effflux MFS transporter, partial [Gammaproteobacteria bacterium]|nr:multidrug effflux MFS transporter [Gammaproteobacteria bacterium]